jgi:uncharacterized protein (DUF305 family)
MSVDTADETTATEPGAEAARPSLRVVLMAIMAVAVVAVGVAGGYFWGSRGGSSDAAVKPSPVDIGFARDMATHHQQAITMATYVRDHSTDLSITTLAYDIESSQTIQLGEMTGWLDTWNLTRYTAHPMVWMRAAHASHVVNGLMPGMATPTQMTRLMSLHGKALDVFFLQLMIHHHQGGLPMARYAEQHAKQQYVRTLAGHMIAAQSAEIVEMEQMLRQRGGSPLPAPSS